MPCMFLGEEFTALFSRIDLCYGTAALLKFDHTHE